MEYIQVHITVLDPALRDILIAQLSDLGYDGFEEREDTLIAYIAANIYSESATRGIIAFYHLQHATSAIAEQNWNRMWEENFQPVVVDGVCTVRAHFHDMVVHTPYDIVITPKMSFGTGHHATTQLMMMQMSKMDIKDKHVFDFGTGTGILAILAEMMGATTVTAIDNDEWSYQNAVENLERNNCKKIVVMPGSAELLKGKQFDIILANINRNILLEYMPELFLLLKTGGKVLMSGLLQEDKPAILIAATQAGFSFISSDGLNNWVSLLFEKKHS